MSNIEKSNGNVPNLALGSITNTNYLLSVEKCVKSPKITEVSIPEFSKFIEAQLKILYFRAGFKFNEQDLDALHKVICELIYKEFKHYSLEMINQALEKGVKKELGDFAGISYTTIYGFLRKFNDGYQKELAAYKKEKDREVPKFILSDEQKKSNREFLINDILNDLEKYKKSKSFELHDRGSLKYDYLNSLGLIQFTEERKKEIQEIVRLRLIDQKNQQRKVDLNKKWDLKREIEALQTKDKSANQILVIECKFFTYKEVLEKFITENTDLKTILTEKQ